IRSASRAMRIVVGPPWSASGDQGPRLNSEGRKRPSSSGVKRAFVIPSPYGRPPEAADKSRGGPGPARLERARPESRFSRTKRAPERANGPWKRKTGFSRTKRAPERANGPWKRDRGGGIESGSEQIAAEIGRIA